MKEQITLIDNDALIELFASQGIDLVVSFSQQTRLWLTKVNSSNGYLFIDPLEANLFVDGRYIEYATEKAQNANVHLLKMDAVRAFVDEKMKVVKKIGVESDYLTLSELNTVRNWFPMIEIVPFNGAKLRMVKSNEEAAFIGVAAQIALRAVEQIKDKIQPGITEKQIDSLLEKTMRDLGGDKGSFDAIIASGFRGSLPHGRASTKVIQNNEYVTIDFGTVYKGYSSDITRTFKIGEPHPKLVEAYEVVAEAQKRGIAAICAGVSTFAIDRICRDYITERGFGKYFTHSTGHGLGIDVHEFPSVGNNKILETILEAGMVITVEPGIYIPGLGGIRIEDDVLVTETGNKVLSSLDNSLIIPDEPAPVLTKEFVEEVPDEVVAAPVVEEVKAETEVKADGKLPTVDARKKVEVPAAPVVEEAKVAETETKAEKPAKEAKAKKEKK